MIITIDGASGTGKTTVAQKVAEKLGIHYFDTGALYRCFAWFCLENPGSLQTQLETFNFSIKQNGNGKQYFVGTKDVSDQIRLRQVTTHASQLSALPQVRAALLSFQRDFAKGQNVVFEGRDLGTVVFPHAEVKIFLVADPQIKARRRLAEMRSKNLEETQHVTEEEIREEMLKRDTADSTREVAPLKVPENAYVIDTTLLSIEEVINLVVSRVRSLS